MQYWVDISERCQPPFTQGGHKCWWKKMFAQIIRESQRSYMSMFYCYAFVTWAGKQSSTNKCDKSKRCSNVAHVIPAMAELVGGQLLLMICDKHYERTCTKQARATVGKFWQIIQFSSNLAFLCPEYTFARRIICSQPILQVGNYIIAVFSHYDTDIGECLFCTDIELCRFLFPSWGTSLHTDDESNVWFVAWKKCQTVKYIAEAEQVGIEVSSLWLTCCEGVEEPYQPCLLFHITVLQSQCCSYLRKRSKIHEGFF